VLIAVFADIHANRQAFEACLARARNDGAEKIYLLGDIVGYGADPDWCTQTAMDIVGQGALAVRGNHDNAIAVPSERMNAKAQVAIEWTRNVLGRAERDFLARLPLAIEDAGRLLVHADATAPAQWHYVTDGQSAARSLDATQLPLTLCGHVHIPALYSLSSVGKITPFTPKTGVPIQLMKGRKWLAVIGSVGQPRDGNPAASYAMLDTDRNEITFCRAPYDIDEAAARIRKNGLPPSLAERLYEGH